MTLQEVELMTAEISDEEPNDTKIEKEPVNKPYFALLPN